MDRTLPQSMPIVPKPGERETGRQEYRLVTDFRDLNRPDPNPGTERRVQFSATDDEDMNHPQAGPHRFLRLLVCSKKQHQVQPHRKSLSCRYPGLSGFTSEEESGQLVTAPWHFHPQSLGPSTRSTPEKI